MWYDIRELQTNVDIVTTNFTEDQKKIFINDMIEAWVPGTGTKLPSSDVLEDYRDVMRFNTEYVNTLCPNGFPRHLLTLKKGMVLMVLRYISPKEGLCNGTKGSREEILNNQFLENTKYYLPSNN